MNKYPDTQIYKKQLFVLKEVQASLQQQQEMCVNKVFIQHFLSADTLLLLQLATLTIQWSNFYIGIHIEVI